MGGLISEFGPGTKGRPAHFPMRNRIISGLSDCVIVVEAREKSGALITADCALEQGREVFALPGRVGDRLSEGCNRLIQEGAFLLRKPEEVVEFFSIQFSNRSKITVNKKIGLEKEDEMLYSCLDFEPKHLETILQETGFSAAQAMESLMRLELSGKAGQPLKNYYVKKHG